MYQANKQSLPQATPQALHGIETHEKAGSNIWLRRRHHCMMQYWGCIAYMQLLSVHKSPRRGDLHEAQRPR